jgi:hypothetical protein
MHRFRLQQLFNASNKSTHTTVRRAIVLSYSKAKLLSPSCVNSHVTARAHLPHVSQSTNMPGRYMSSTSTSTSSSSSDADENEIDLVTPASTRVGWIGTGVMGKSCAAHILKAGKVY